MTAFERVYLWVAGVVGMLLIERRMVDAWVHRLEARYWARRERP